MSLNLKQKPDKDYFDKLCENITKLGLKQHSKPTNSKHVKPVTTDEVLIPSYQEAHFVLVYNYNLQQLKTIAKHYKLKIGGNKTQLTSRLYSYLELSVHCLKIQKVARGYIQRVLDKLRGQGFIHRDKCTNKIDFLTMDELTQISPHQFFSFTDADGFIYGFDIISFYNLRFNKDNDKNAVVKNPFTMQPINQTVFSNFHKLLRISRLRKLPITTKIHDVHNDVSVQKSAELRVLSIFQHIDALGNYTNPQWFLNLDFPQLIKFSDELYDIWSFRAELTSEKRRNISPNGDPFLRMNRSMLLSLENIDDLRLKIVNILDKMVTTGIDHDCKCLGAYYILGALTLVSHEASVALPWIYQAVYHD